MKFLSPQQEYLLRVLKITGCMRKAQVLTLLRRKFDTSPNAIGPICRQLRDGGYLREYEGIISVVGAGYAPFIPWALDLIFAILPREVVVFHWASHETLDGFGLQSELLVRVLYIPQKQISFALPGKEEFPKQQSVLTVLLLDDATQTAYIPPQFAGLVAYPDEKGKLTLKQHNGGKNYEN